MVVHSFRQFPAMMTRLVQNHPEVRSLVLHTCIFFREVSFVALSITYSAFVLTLLNFLFFTSCFPNIICWVSVASSIIFILCIETCSCLCESPNSWIMSIISLSVRAGECSSETMY